MTIIPSPRPLLPARPFWRIPALVIVLFTVLTFQSAVSTAAPIGPATLAETAPAVFSCADVTEIPQAECEALVALYSSTNGDGWTSNTDWLVTNTPCSWFGVTCSGGHVSQLQLHSNQLSGSIPAELGNLVSVTDINFRANQLNGSIPPELGSLSSLLGLVMDHNQLSGSIPAELGNLSELRKLALHKNQLSGSIPPRLGNLSKVQILWLDDNQLSGSIPVALSNLSNLRVLSLGKNQLSGSIPVALSNLSSLRGLSLGKNQLSGSIPPQLGNAGSLEALWLNNNQLSGSIPAELGNLVNLRTLDLRSNQLSGSIPPQLDNAGSLEYLWLNNNQLSGSIPAALGNLPNLAYLYLDHNTFSGSIPPQLGNLSNLSVLYLSDTPISGSIPPEFGNLANLTFLALGNNQLSGSIPAELGNLVNLRTLDLQNNQLSGSIPPQLGNAGSLKSLWMNNNQLSGSIPAALGNLSNLFALALSNNQLSGNLPSELGNLSDLWSFNLFNNPLSGSIPLSFTQLGNLSGFHFNNTDLCEPSDAAFQTWLAGVSNVSGTGVTCNESTPTPSATPTPTNTPTLTHTPTATPIPPTHTPTFTLTPSKTPTQTPTVTPTASLTPTPTPSQITFQGRLFQNGAPINGFNYVQLWASQQPANIGQFLFNGVTDGTGNFQIITAGGDFTYYHLVLYGINDWSHCSFISATAGPGAVVLDKHWIRYQNPPGGVHSGNTFVLDCSTPTNTPTPTITPTPTPVGFSCLNVTQIPQIECEALAALYSSTDGEGWSDNSGWLASDTPCTWFGVTCRAGHVTRLSLSVNRLDGSLPAELGNLSQLQLLRLRNNQLSGNIPATLGNLGQLEKLDLVTNQLSGAIPAELGNLTGLQDLWLFENQLSGSIPAELGALSNLQGLALYDNQLSGSIPSELGNLSSLQYANLNDNQLSGPIPAEFGNLSNLEWIYLHNNQLSGSIPPELGNLQHLEQLWLDNNQLSGSVPAALGNLSALRELKLSANQLSGNIPAELGNLGNLQRLGIAVNPLSGSIPQDYTNLDLNYFSFAQTNLCEPNNAEFQNWLNEIATVLSTGISCDDPTPTVTRTPTVTPTPTQTPTATPTSTTNDIVVTALELTQGVQDFDNHMPLVKNRVTWARAYVGSSQANVSGISARLRAFRQGTELVGSPLLAENNPISVKVSGGDRLNLNDSYRFYIPPAWRDGAVTFTVEVNYDNVLAEGNTSNNTWSETVMFNPSGSLSMHMVPITLHDNGDPANPAVTYTTSDSSFPSIVNNLYRLHPVSSVQISQAPPLYPQPPYDLRSSVDRVDLLYDIRSARMQSGGAGSAHWMGMIDGGISTAGGLGIAFRPGLDGWSKMVPGSGGYPSWYITGGSTLAHELGHNKGLRHVKCSGSEGNPDPAYPYQYPNCALSAVDPQGYYGFDAYYQAWGLGQPAIISNDPSAPFANRGFPLLGYRRPRWTSPFSYCKLLNVYGISCSGSTPVLQTQGTQAVLTTTYPQSDEYLLVGGIIDSNEMTAVIRDIHRLTELPAAGISTIDASPYTLAVLNSEGEVLVSKLIHAEVSESEEGIAPFVEIIAVPAGATHVQVRAGETILAERIADANPPTIDLLEPLAGSLQAGTIIRWTASDPDGSTLSFDLFYSADDGVTWGLIAMSLGDTSYTLPSLDGLPGGNTVRLKVRANDGFNNAAAISNRLSVPNAAPQAVILQPAADSRYAVGELVLLNGLGIDAEEGALDSEQHLTWLSDIDGWLGNGAELPVRTLSAGTHTITLEVTDSAGQLARNTIQIRVGFADIFMPLLLAAN